MEIPSVSIQAKKPLALCSCFKKAQGVTFSSDTSALLQERLKFIEAFWKYEVDRISTRTLKPAMLN